MKLFWITTFKTFDEHIKIKKWDYNFKIKKWSLNEMNNNANHNLIKDCWELKLESFE